MASVSSSAVVPVSGSPAGRNLSHVLGPQLVPEKGTTERVKNKIINIQINKIKLIKWKKNMPLSVINPGLALLAQTL